VLLQLRSRQARLFSGDIDNSVGDLLRVALTATRVRHSRNALEWIDARDLGNQRAARHQIRDRQVQRPQLELAAFWNNRSPWSNCAKSSSKTAAVAPLAISKLNWIAALSGAGEQRGLGAVAVLAGRMEKWRRPDRARAGVGMDRYPAYFGVRNVRFELQSTLTLSQHHHCEESVPCNTRNSLPCY